MATVIPLADLQVSPTAALFQGGDDAALSIFVTAYDRAGQGPDLHLHPYPEVFVVQAGAGRFTVGDEEVLVEAGHVLVVPGQTPHKFENAGGGTLQVIGVHPSGEVEQTNLEEN